MTSEKGEQFIRDVLTLLPLLQSSTILQNEDCGSLTARQSVVKVDVSQVFWGPF